MRSWIALSIALVVLSASGSTYGTVFRADCLHSGERGWAGSLDAACAAVGCEEAPVSDDDCAATGCCAFQELPGQPAVPPSTTSALGDFDALVHAALGARADVPAFDRMPRRAARPEIPPGAHRASFSGFALPLLI